MNEQQIVDMWLFVKELVDKKNIDPVAENYIDLCADFGTNDDVFKNCLGNCDSLDSAISYYLDLDNEEDDCWDD